MLNVLTKKCYEQPRGPERDRSWCHRDVQRYVDCDVLDPANPLLKAAITRAFPAVCKRLLQKVKMAEENSNLGETIVPGAEKEVELVEPEAVPRPDRDAHEAKIAEVNKTISELKEKSERIKSRIDGAKRSNDEVKVRCSNLADVSWRAGCCQPGRGIG